MILVAQTPRRGEILKLQQKLELKGFHSYSVKTSKGFACTVLNFNESELKSLYDFKEYCTLIEHDVPYILASKKIKDIPTIIKLNNNVSIGNSLFTIIAGPCSVESETQIHEIARQVKAAGAHILRGGVYKSRTSPYSFQGIGEKGLKILRAAGDQTGMPIITEVMDTDDISKIVCYADILQIGARNCQNYSFLKKIGKIDKPVLLKRGMMTTIEEFLLAAEYILTGGNMNVILCERGIRTFETETRNTLDISAVPILKQKTHLPVMVDPSHAAGSWEIIEPLCLAALVAGADGIIVEVHSQPHKALCDGKQSLKPERFARITEKLKALARFMHKEI